MIEPFAAVLTSVWVSDLFWALAVAAIAGLVLGYTGFGGALVMMPLMAILYGPVEALGLMGISTFLASLPIGWTAARETNWPEVGPMVVALFFGVPIGMIFLFYFDPVIIKRVIGVSVISATIILYLGWVYKGPRNAVMGVISGGLCGCLTGFSGIGGPPAVVYILASGDSAVVQRSGIVMISATVMGALLASLIWNEALTPEIVVRGILITPIQVIGAKVGEKLFHLAPDRFFRRVAIWTLMFAGIAVMVA